MASRNRRVRLVWQFILRLLPLTFVLSASAQVSPNDIPAVGVVNAWGLPLIRVELATLRLGARRISVFLTHRVEVSSTREARSSWCLVPFQLGFNWDSHRRLEFMNVEGRTVLLRTSEHGWLSPDRRFEAKETSAGKITVRSPHGTYQFLHGFIANWEIEPWSARLVPVDSLSGQRQIDIEINHAREASMMLNTAGQVTELRVGHGRCTFEYADGRLVRVTTSSAGSTKTISFGYDGNLLASICRDGVTENLWWASHDPTTATQFDLPYPIYLTAFANSKYRLEVAARGIALNCTNLEGRIEYVLWNPATGRVTQQDPRPEPRTYNIGFDAAITLPP